ncbi:unnamed protein product, partial [Ectocarpus sp. 13 AM-2016]
PASNPAHTQATTQASRRALAVFETLQHPFRTTAIDHSNPRAKRVSGPSNNLRRTSRGLCTSGPAESTGQKTKNDDGPNSILLLPPPPPPPPPLTSPPSTPLLPAEEKNRTG